MENTSLNDLREKFLKFFESKGHLRLTSYPLVPENDASLLLINAGMAPLKRYFTGEETPPSKRVTTCQKCIRTPDIENAGRTSRHGTFFEMLGNFSFGDYFKEKAIPWAWEFLTVNLKIPAEKLYITIFEEDGEALEVWKSIGVPEERIYKMGRDDNFWEIGAGPCGPDSEIHFDRGEKYGCGNPDCSPGCDCDRFIEIWNIVFTQFDSDGKGNYTPLSRPNIDTGMGLERLACIMQGVGSLFEVDTIKNIMGTLCETAGVKYNGGEGENDISLRVITDHIRSATFLIGDGVLPSNEGRGYVLRRLLRRASRHGRLLGIDGTFLPPLAKIVIAENKAAYPELAVREEFIEKVISTEEEKFAQTIGSGLLLLEKEIALLKARGETVLPGENVFKLYDTFGFPIDLTREIAKEARLEVDEDGFQSLMANQRKKARDARAKSNGAGWTDENLIFGDEQKTEFTGYETLSGKAKLLYIIKEGENTSLLSGGEAVLALDKTPFYAESGGQIGDHGTISSDDGVFEVTDTTKTGGGVFLHHGRLKEGKLKLGKVFASVDPGFRGAVTRNHSSAHLLQAALRTVLGNHVEQAGSYVSEDILRFDFTHFNSLTKDEIKETERLVNSEILKGSEIKCHHMKIDEARKTGATAIFGEKYGEVVRVVSMGSFSTEFCGGTHLDNTAKVGLFKIISESSIAAGTRRIEAITGLNSLKHIYENESLIRSAAEALKCQNINELPAKAALLGDEIKSLKKSIDKIHRETVAAKAEEVYLAAKETGGVKLVTAEFKDIPVTALREAADEFLAKHGDAVTLFASISGGNVTFSAGCGETALAKKVDAGKILAAISPIVGGGGGGRRDRATSGGKKPENTRLAFDSALNVLESQISKPE